ncbi:MAG: HAD-IIIA family hydrolase [Pirellulaceae bacterium]
MGWTVNMPLSRNQRPTQAVILAGGRGTRLLPLTETRPKPMLTFSGRPFLEYLIEQAREQGFEKILLLVGYLPETIRDYFGDGLPWGVSIQYSAAPVEDDTGARLRKAQPLLDETFLLLYCDNYWPMNFAEMWDHFERSQAEAQLTVYRNTDGYTKNNLELAGASRVVRYDKTRLAAGLSGVDIGYAILHRSVVDLLPNENVNFESLVYPQLASRGVLGGFPTDHRYYSVGTHERLTATASFLERRRAVILDRDGVLNVKPPRAHYVTCWEDFVWLPGSKEAVRLLKEHEYTVIVASNQAGVSRGALSLEELNRIHEAMNEDLRLQGGCVDAVYACPHGWDENCCCRKPQPGLLLQAQRDFHLDLTRIWFIGDDERDEEAGRRAGCRTALVQEHRGLLDVVRDTILVQ